MSTAVTWHGHHYRDGRHLHRFRLFLVQGRVAAAAIIVLGAELDQQAVIATNDLP
jgi:hypothetical protein